MIEKINAVDRITEFIRGKFRTFRIERGNNFIFVDLIGL